ncbi:MAG TPA: ATP-binding protein, partial [Fibrella sp.]
PEDRAAGIPEEEAQTARQQGRAIDERYHQRKDGSQPFVSGVQSPLFDSMGTLLGYVKIARDLTQRQQMEQDLRDADKRKDEFLAMLAHELRNPLAPIANILQVLTLSGEGNKTIVPALNMMSRQVEHLVRLIDDLLDVSRISRGKVKLRRERMELTAVVRQALEAASPIYRAQSRQLNVTLPAAPIYLLGDATRLTQVVSNLLTNGARYTREKGQVQLSVEEVNGEAILRVADNGIGLAKDQLSRIFDLFMQVDTALDRSQGGLGLGLTLVRKLVEMHDGQVEARSEGLGRGSEFIVKLPTLPQTEKSIETSAMTKTPTPKLPGHRILVVDDNRDAADTLTMLLKLKKHQVHTRYGGREAIEAAQSVEPEVVLLDISMPDLDGYETCQQIRQQPWGKDLVLIALTGYGQDEDIRRSLEAGFNGHLVKPIDLAKLTELLNSLLPAQAGN